MLVFNLVWAMKLNSLVYLDNINIDATEEFCCKTLHNKIYFVFKIKKREIIRSILSRMTY